MIIPSFGTKEAHKTYQERYGVYAVIPNPEKTHLILVQAPNGAWFLPGGEIEKGENQTQALARELREELGFSAQLGAYLGQADEYFYSSHRDTYYHNPAYIYEALSYHILGEPLEDFNHVAWFSIQEAREKLKRGSHKWGIDQWLAKEKS